MPIPEVQLQTWSNQGATVTAQATHESIRLALSHTKSPLTEKGIQYDVYLQGSYKNDTNIRGNSDVDVVVQLDSSYNYNTSSLSQTDLAKFKSAAIPATYTWPEFRTDVIRALELYYGSSSVEPSDKCIKLPAAPGRVNADIIPCIQYRKYMRYTGASSDYVEGMKFWTSTGSEVINYPKIHHKNGAAKNEVNRAKGGYKPSVRMFKNARDTAIVKYSRMNISAPSYFVECLLYNVPDIYFLYTFQYTYENAVRWLVQQTDLSKFVCQNEQVYLFGDTPQQWNINDARLLIAVWGQLSSDWR